MDKKRVVITVVVLVVLVAVLWSASGWLSGVTGYGVLEDGKWSLAMCLGEKGSVMYGDSDCQVCDEQQELFGDAFAQITYVDCSSGGCEDLPSVPAWQIDGTVYYGVKTLEALKVLSRC
jgi:hypothetical protein